MPFFDGFLEIGPAKTFAHFGYADVALMNDVVLPLLVIWSYEVGDVHDGCRPNDVSWLSVIKCQMALRSCDIVGPTMNLTFNGCSSAR